MKKPRQSKILAAIALLALSLGAMGNTCQDEHSVPGPSATCEAGTAQIAVHDGYLQRVCGCGGTDGEMIASPGHLSCTLEIGSTVFIHYFGARLPHRIIPTGTPDFPIGPIYDPRVGDTDMVRASAFEPAAVGTYLFQDEFQVDLTGDFIVTP